MTPQLKIITGTIITATVCLVAIIVLACDILGRRKPVVLDDGYRLDQDDDDSADEHGCLDCAAAQAIALTRDLPAEAEILARLDADLDHRAIRAIARAYGDRRWTR